MKKIFIMSNLIPLLLVVYITKSFIMGASFFDFGIISLMSLSFLYKLKLDQSKFEETEELKAIISQLEVKVNERLDKLQKTQDNDRLAAEGKFSTLNLGMQQQPKPRAKETYGWG